MSHPIITDKEELLEYVRGSRNTNGSTETIGQSSETIPDELYSNSDDNSDDYREGRQAAYSNDGRNTGTTDGAGSYRRLIDQIGDFNQFSTGSDGSTNKYQSRDGRLSEPSGNGSTTRSTIGDIIKQRVKPVREAVKKVAKVALEPNKNEPKTKKSAGRTLSESEAKQLKPKLIEVILWQTEHADSFITATTKGHHEVEIWGNMDSDEAEIIVDFILERGKKNVQAASIARNLSVLMDRIKLGLIVGPRAYRTVAYYVKQGVSLW